MTHLLCCLVLFVLSFHIPLSPVRATESHEDVAAAAAAPTPIDWRQEKKPSTLFEWVCFHIEHPEDKRANLLMADQFLKKLPDSLITRAYKRLVDELQNHPSAQPPIDQFPQEAQCFVKASRLARKYHQATSEVKRLEIFKEVISLRNKTSHLWAFYCSHILETQADLQRRRHISPTDLAHNASYAFKLGAFALGQFICDTGDDPLLQALKTLVQRGKATYNTLDAKEKKISSSECEILKLTAPFLLKTPLIDGDQGVGLYQDHTILLALFSTFPHFVTKEMNLHEIGAAVLGQALACSNLSVYYEYGRNGFPWDYTLARVYSQRARAALPPIDNPRTPLQQQIHKDHIRGLAQAHINLAISLRNGSFLPQDFEDALAELAQAESYDILEKAKIEHERGLIKFCSKQPPKHFLPHLENAANLGNLNAAQDIAIFFHKNPSCQDITPQQVIKYMTQYAQAKNPTH